MKRAAERPRARCLAVLGTGSDVGKSFLVTALCRLLSDAGVEVAPFKAQNMSNNSFVTLDGGEMGRAQVAQAEAARVEPHVDMNPVLLKPAGELGVQVIVGGRAIGHRAAGSYYRMSEELSSVAAASLERLRRRHQVVVLEGAGSCAELNLAVVDFVNLRSARWGEAPILLVADIERGGVFAQILGTLGLLPPPDRERVAGIVVNRFRGDLRLFESGVDILERRSGVPVLGVLPLDPDLRVDDEDSLRLDAIVDLPSVPDPRRVRIAVLCLPHLSNHTDFGPLEGEATVDLRFLRRPRPLDDFDAVILPGTKNVRGDLEWMERTGWRSCLLDHAARGGRVIGICGGFQMLGRRVVDPEGVEGPRGETAGLGLLELDTALAPGKTLRRTRGVHLDSGEAVTGYEIHHGETRNQHAPAILSVERAEESGPDTDGARDASGRVWGCYLHGLFDEPGFRRSVLRSVRPDLSAVIDRSDAASAASGRERHYDAVARHVAGHLDVARVFALLGLPRPPGLETTRSQAGVEDRPMTERR